MPRTELYRSSDLESEVRRWCTDRLRSWSVSHRTTVLRTGLGDTHLTLLGAGADVCVYVPGTNFCAATSTAVLEALAARCRVVCVDLPGQPGLSTAVRPRDDWHVQERWLREVLHQARGDHVGRLALVGHSRGAAVGLSVDPSAVDALVLISPAGLAKAQLTPRTLLLSLAWLIRPTDRRSARLVDMMAAPGTAADLSGTVEWMTLVARSTRTSGAPGPLPPDVLARWRGHDVRVLVGEDDVFFPPDRLADPVSRNLGARFEVVPGAGHLLPDQRAEAVAAAVMGGKQPGPSGVTQAHPAGDVRLPRQVGVRGDARVQRGGDVVGPGGGTPRPHVDVEGRSPPSRS